MTKPLRVALAGLDADRQQPDAGLVQAELHLTLHMVKS